MADLLGRDFEDYLYDQELKESIYAEEIRVKRFDAVANFEKKRRKEIILQTATYIATGLIVTGAIANLARDVFEPRTGNQVEPTPTEQPMVKNDFVTNSTKIYCEMKPYLEILSQETYRTESNQHYWYNTGNIASKLLEQGDVEVGFYTYYKEMYDANKHLSEVIRLVSSFDENNEVLNGDYSSFDDYLFSKGYVDKEGKIDYDSYDKDMKNYLVDRYNFSEGNKGVEDARKMSNS